MIDRDAFHFLSDNEYEIIPPNDFCPGGGLDITWNTDIGFGHYVIMFDENGRPHADTECMDANCDKWFTKQILMKLAEEIDVR